jgi:hypothetical protein
MPTKKHEKYIAPKQLKLRPAPESHGKPTFGRAIKARIGLDDGYGNAPKSLAQAAVPTGSPALRKHNAVADRMHTLKK